MRDLAQHVYTLAGSDLPCVRADWFIATAARPPLYHTLLDLSHTAGELERRLGVDVERDFLRGTLARAGFLSSGVSKQNRLVDRHRTLFGAYWKSYDFKSNDGRGSLVRFPLGPVFAGSPFSDQAFEHAGGELIFHLPNCLQGYMLVNQKGEHLDEAPVEIVSDSQETSGTPVIVNGLSCMTCHKQGMIRFADRLREGSAVAGEAREKVQQLFRKPEEMDQLLQQDEDRFVGALSRAVKPFLSGSRYEGKETREVPEPIGAVVRLHLADLGPEQVAFELGLSDARKLRALVEANRRLRELGLGPLVSGGAIKRETWASLRTFTSLYQEVSRELELGTPFRVQ